MEVQNLRREKEEKQLNRFSKPQNDLMLHTHQYKKSEVFEKNETEIKESMKKRKS